MLEFGWIVYEITSCVRYIEIFENRTLLITGIKQAVISSRVDEFSG